MHILKEDIAEYLQRKTDKTLSLNERERRVEREAGEAKAKARDKLRARAKAQGSKDADDTRQDDGLQANERSLKEELAAEKVRKLAPDIVLTEAANILSDGLSLVQSSTRLARQALLNASRLKREPNESGQLAR